MLLFSKYECYSQVGIFYCPIANLGCSLSFDNFLSSFEFALQ